MKEETIERRLLLGGVEAVRQLGGDALVQILLRSGQNFEDESAPARVPLADYLRYRDAALDFLQETFCATAFETGRILARSLIGEHEAQLRGLVSQFAEAPNKLPLIGQAAVLGARGNPGNVRATMRGAELLVILIENCPECRGLARDAPFCYLNQGLITELAERCLGLRVEAEETSCMATGGRACEIHVGLAADSAGGVPIVVCAWCHRVRLEDRSWHERPDLEKRPTLTHGICEDCAQKFSRH